MDFGHGGRANFPTRATAAAFAYLALLHLDTVAIAPFATRLGKPLVVSGGRDRFWPVVEFLSSLNCGGETDLFHSTKEFLSRFPERHSAASPISSTRREASGPWKCCETAGHDLVLVQVHSADEQRPAVLAS